MKTIMATVLTVFLFVTSSFGQVSGTAPDLDKEDPLITATKDSVESLYQTGATLDSLQRQFSSPDSTVLLKREQFRRIFGNTAHLVERLVRRGYVSALKEYDPEEAERIRKKILSSMKAAVVNVMGQDYLGVVMNLDITVEMIRQAKLELIKHGGEVPSPRPAPGAGLLRS